MPQPAVPLFLRNLPESPVREPSGHSRPLQDTWEWVRPKLKAVPITRILDVTPIGRLGLPVWSAVTPLAKDLTVHAGKGRTSEAARLSAVMEAIERVCAEEIEQDRTVRSSYDELARGSPPAVDPVSCCLPFETAYRPDQPLTWVKGVDLLQDEEVLVPLDLVLSPPVDGVCTGVETNGLASGNDYTEATVHALYELVERDAVAEDEFCRLMLDPWDSRWRPARTIDLDTLPDECVPWITRILSEGRTIRLHRITNAIGLPVFRAALYDPHFPGAIDEICCEGYGADLSPRRAVLRALTEAVQGHTVLTLGSRDSYEGLEPLPDRPAWLMNKLGERFPTAFAPFEDGRDPVPETQKDALTTILRHLRAFGLPRCIVVDLGKPHIGVPVVRVIVPGLSAPFGASMRRPSTRLLRQLI